MDINDLRGLATILTMLAFSAIVFWAYSGKRKKQFDDAANSPFDGDEQSETQINTEKQNNE